MKPPEFKEIHEFGNLLRAAKKAMKGRWRYRREHAVFRLDLGRELLRIQEELVSKTYVPGEYRTFWAYDPKKRLISAAPLRDRVVHHALIGVVGPWLERSFIYDNYACRKGKGTHLAIQKAQRFARRYSYYCHLDVVKFFDTIDLSILKKMVRKKITDPDTIWLIEKIIDFAGTGGKGVPIGNLTSQYFGNLYLDELDHFVKDRKGVRGYLRYMDDVLVFHDDRRRLKGLVREIDEFASSLSLSFSEKEVHPVFSGIPFLGLRIFPNGLRVQPSRWKRFKQRFKSLLFAFQGDEISEEHFLLSSASMISHLDKADTYRLRGPFFEEWEMNFQGIGK